ncbi:aminotransferase class III-fold pyridoxal phosphate-dependent enzyme [Rhodospirillaceae bacterium SYSU D60014]|uniref:aminotransferase class III-fold pyridoxal phosphate-dependent enzyme n=1 Tax=Virgifigura deserti TaxID=2268457 RepID=UPI000E665A90
MTNFTKALSDSDRRYAFHPVTRLAEHAETGGRVWLEGRGVHLQDMERAWSIDGFSGLWCVNAGYGQTRIVDAITRQLEKLPYGTSFFSYANEPSILLAERLAEITPESVTRSFFTLGGSDAVDTALKLIRNYFISRGEPDRINVIALQRGYHGASFLGAGVTGLAAYHQPFGLPFAFQHHIPSHYMYRNPAGDDPKAVIEKSVEDLNRKIDELGEHTVAAFFCEPIQGSGGVIVPPSGWLHAMQDLCRRRGVLFVIDEVITGFGRTGPMFASELENLMPDALILAKGLTSAYVPMGACVVSEDIFQTIMDGAGRDAYFTHGFTYSGHPVAAAAALAAIDIYESELLDNVRKVAPAFLQRLHSLRNDPLVGDTRGVGLLGAAELVADKEARTPFSPELRLDRVVAGAASRHKVIFRTFTDGTLGFAPALCISEEEINVLFDRVELVLDDVRRHLRGGT